MTLNTLSIRANEINRVMTGTQVLTTPKVNGTTADAVVYRIDLDGYIFTGLVLDNIEGNAEAIIDLNNGITYELITDLGPVPLNCVAPVEEIDYLNNPFSGLPAGVA